MIRQACGFSSGCAAAKHVCARRVPDVSDLHQSQRISTDDEGKPMTEMNAALAWVRTATPAIAASHDVLVVGTGPVGLFSPASSASPAVQVLVVESESAPNSPPKAFPLSMRGLSAGGLVRSKWVRR